MQDAVDVALSILGDLLWAAFGVVGRFLLQFFPDADAGIVNTIGSWSGAMSGFDLTFNVFYFVDIGIVSLFATSTVFVVLAFFIFTMVREVYALVHKLLDSIPVLG